MGRRSGLKRLKPTKVEKPVCEPLRATIPVYSSKIAAKIARFLINELGMSQVSWWSKDVLIRGEAVSDKMLAKAERAIIAMNRLYTTILEEKYDIT